MGKLITFDLTLIAICNLITTVMLVVVALTLYKILNRLNENINFLDSQVRSTVRNVTRTVNSFTENVKAVSTVLGFFKRDKNKKEK
jgi:uncharacterized protein YoxC